MRRMGLIIVLLLIFTLTVAAQDDAKTPTEICEAAATDDPTTRSYTQAEQVLEEGVDYHAVFCTGAGAVYVDLFEDYAPATVNNFVFLAQNNFYNNTNFHRVIQDFMAQGGDPDNTGSGGPGYQFKDEFVGFLHFDQPGLLAMANANRPEQGIVGTNGSQFFITTVPTPHLDYRHTIFGEVLEGQENVTSIEIRDPQSASTPGTELSTIVIITDPASVVTTYAAPEAATQEEVQAAFDNIGTAFTEFVPAEMFSVDAEHSGTQTPEEAAALVSEDVRADYSEFLSNHNFEYQVTNTINNASCDVQQFPLHTLRYTLMSFASAEDAAAALADEALGQTTVAQGFAEVTDSQAFEGTNVYTQTPNVCEKDASLARVYLQRGHFVVIAEATIPADLGVGADLLLNQVILLYERMLASVLRAEV